MEYSIEVHNLKKAYEGSQILKGINFHVEKGEICALLGPNGAGKSTTISMIASLLEIDQGHIKIDGSLVGLDDAAICKKLGIVFQNSVLDNILSVKDNLLLRCGFYGIPAKEAHRRVQDIAQKCALESLLNRKVKTLSGGEHRRADIARALLHEPNIMILDEPCTGLDPNARKKLWETILQLHEVQHMTILMTTHYMEEAELAHHICILKQGEILIDDTLNHLKKTFGKQQLVMYSSCVQTLQRALQKLKIPYVMKQKEIVIEPLNHFHTMSILRKCEMYMDSFELSSSSLEEVYLRLLKEGQHDIID